METGNSEKAFEKLSGAVSSDTAASSGGSLSSNESILHDNGILPAGVVLQGALAIVAVFALGSAAFGPRLAVECMLVGMVEETIFTGLIFSNLRKHSRKAAAITALLFALCHLAMPWKVPIAFVFSLCMIWIYRRSRSLAWPICAHSVFDMLWFGLFMMP